MSSRLRRTPWIIFMGIAMSLLTGSLGCGLASRAMLTSTPSPEPPTAIPSATEDRVGTQTAEANLRLTSTAKAASTATMRAVGTATATAGVGATATLQAKETRSARNTSIAADLKSTGVAQSVTKTAMVSEMAQVVQKLKDDGYLTKTRGSYHRLADFDESWAQINWYRWRDSDHAPTEFVVQADASWDTASLSANLFNSGCGFVFSETDRDNHQLVYWGLDGNVYAERVKDGFFYPLGMSYYGPVSVPKGAARLMLVVENERITVFVDGEKIMRVRDPYYKEGSLGITLLSGTNKGFGTRCQMKNVHLWWLEQ